jgi:ribosomal protein RSM22 (predicted rRNA methylase)
MSALGQELARTATLPAVRDATRTHASVTQPPPADRHDLVILAYVLGELDTNGQDQAINCAADATTDQAGLTVIVEPGTPEGCALILRARERLLACGGFVTAPCPHDRPCPLSGNDWCHFSVRLPRTAVDRAAKHADLGYEDEKFAYIAVSRQPTPRTSARVVRRPRIRPRLVQLELCTPDGLRTVTVTKRDRDGFRRARKIAWGEGFDYTPGDATDSTEAP